MQIIFGSCSKIKSRSSTAEHIQKFRMTVRRVWLQVRCAVYTSAAEVIQVGGFAATHILAQSAIDAAQHELLGTQSADSAVSASWQAGQVRRT